MERRRVLEPRGLRPVERARDGGPRRDWRELLLADVVVEARPVLADAAAEHERRERGAVGEVGVVPVVHAGADDHRAAAAGALRRIRPLAREPDDLRAIDAGVLLLPGRGERRGRVVVARGVLAREPSPHAVLREEQVLHGRDRDRPLVGLHDPHRHAAAPHAIRAEVRHLELHDRVVTIEEGERRVDRRAVLPVLELQVPLTLLRLPAEPEAPCGIRGASAARSQTRNLNPPCSSPR